MRTSSPTTRFMIAVGLMACMTCASGCSTLHDVKGYYSSSRWYEDLGTAASVVAGVGLVVGVVALCIFIVSEGGECGGFSESYYASDYYRRTGYGKDASTYLNTGYRYSPAYHGSGSSSK